MKMLHQNFTLIYSLSAYTAISSQNSNSLHKLVQWGSQDWKGPTLMLLLPTLGPLTPFKSFLLSTQHFN